MKRMGWVIPLSFAMAYLWLLGGCPSTSTNTKKDEVSAGAAADAGFTAFKKAADAGAAVVAPVARRAAAAFDSSKGASGLFNEGVQLAQNNQPKEAIVRFEAALKQKPSMHQAWYNIGVMQDRLNDTAGSERAYQSALRLKPDFYEAAINLSRLYLRLKRTSQATTLLEQKANAHPTDLRFRNALIYMKIYSGQLAQGEQMARAIQRKDEKNAQAVMNLGLVWYKQKKYELAKSAFDIARKSMRSDALPLYYLGFVYMKLKNNSSAIDSLQNAIKLQPAYPEAYNALGVLYMKTTKVALAEMAFKQAVKYMPRFWEAHLNLGIAMRKNQKTSQAHEQFLALSKLNPYYTETYYYLGIMHLDHKLTKGRLQPAQFATAVPPSLQREKPVYRQLEKIARYATSARHLQTYISRKPQLAADAPARKYLADAQKKKARAEKGLKGVVRRMNKRRLRKLRRRRPPPPARRAAPAPAPAARTVAPAGRPAAPAGRPAAPAPAPR